MNVDNFILTKYNVGIFTGKYAKRAELWMEERLKIFKEYTFPSVLAQIKQDFKWLIFLDGASSDSWVDGIEDIVADHSFCNVIFTEQDDIVSDARKFVNSLTDADCTITTRMDNDDAIHNKFIHMTRFVASNLVDQGYDSFCINYDWGIVYDPRKKDARFSKQASNPFISRVETTKEKETVWGFKHTEAHLNKKKFSLGEPTGPMWVQMVHGMNVSNGLQGAPYSGYKKPPFDVEFDEYYSRNFK